MQGPKKIEKKINVEHKGTGKEVKTSEKVREVLHP